MEMLYTLENINQLNTKGFTIIDNVLPLDLAEEIYSAYCEETKWDLFDQVRENHYRHVFKSPNPFLPQEEEIYSAKFNRSNNLENLDLITNTFNNILVPLLKSISPFHINEFDVRCYKLDKDNLISVMNPYSKETATLPWFAVAVYQMIKDAEIKENYTLMQGGLSWFQKYFTKEYYTLLD